jgi:hypothetical protein
MKFLNPEPPLSELQVDECEAGCGLLLPKALRQFYLFSNGGEPEPYVFRDKIDTVVSEFLPLLTENEDQLTAIEVYQHLVLDQAIVPSAFFPFAVDGGGDFFFTDTSTNHGAVYFYNNDALEESESLVDLELGVADFWKALTPE